MIYTIQPGDSLSKIATEFGFANWETIYYAEENADFRAERPDPNLIEPGDELFIPEIEEIGDGEWAPDEGQHGLSGEEGVADNMPDETEEEPAVTPDRAKEENATAVLRVCRNLRNTINSRPGGYHWFSA